MRERDYVRWEQNLRGPIRGIAIKLARGDRDLQDDLEQVGRIRLSRATLTKCRLNPSSYLKQAIKFAMIDYLRSQGGHRFLNLDELKAQGWELVDLDDGTCVLRRDRPYRRLWQPRAA